MKKRALTVFATAFAMVLLAGVAFAQIGPFGSDDPIDEAATTVEDQDSPNDQATIPVADEPEDEPSDHQDSVDSETQEPDHEESEEPVDEEEPSEDAEHEDEPADTTPPDFVILHPENGQHFDDKSIAFEGEVEPGARVFAGDYEADVDDDGNWRIVLFLEPGQNVATLRAVDPGENVTTNTVTVYYDVPEEEPGEEGGGEGEEPGEEGGGEGEEPGEEGGGDEGEEPTEAEFSANQQYGSCGEDVPYDVFWGTANPGATVHVVSDFGSGTTTADDSGNWEIRVEFPEAPFDDAFEVVIEADGGGRKVFSFVRTGDGGEHEG